MTLADFSNGFDTLVNSYRRFRNYDSQEAVDSIEFNEYEKSLFLTQAQEEIVVGYYSGKNPSGDSLESTEEMRRYLAGLVKDSSLSPIVKSAHKSIGNNDKSTFFTLPDNLWFITYESVALQYNACEGYSAMEVAPVTQDEYHRIKKNPFRGANSRRALRLDLADGVVEIVCKYPVASYYVRYVKKLNPIVLEKLPNNLTVDGEGGPLGCELHEALHYQILERAVLIGLQSKGYRVNNSENR